MHFSIATVAAAAFAFGSFSNAHLIMKTPVPFGVDSLNNSPLNDAKPGTSGSDYPCKQRPGVYDITKMNHIAVDTPTEMSFEGSASHGGGTCQIAITKDKEPTANSTFKIIQVFEGGCPVSSDGNGGTHPFSFSIPKDFPNGVMTLTWLWYNRIGNREAYQNCAPITVTGGSDNDDYFDSLPNMYLINLPTSECQSTQDYASNSVKIPHPGQFFMQEPAGQDIAPASGPQCAASAAAMTEGVSGYKASPIITTNGAAYSAPGGAAAPEPSAAPSGSYGGSAAQPSAAPSGSYGGSSAAAGGSSAPGGYSAPASSAAVPSSAPAGSGSPSGMVTISYGASGGASSAAAGSSAPAYSAPAASGSAQAPSAASGSAQASSAAAGTAYPSMAPSSGASVAGPSSAAASAPPSYGASSAAGASPSGGACSSSGMACSDDGKQFGLCANGKEVWQPVAAGTSCKGGQIVKRNDTRDVHLRRHARAVHRHVSESREGRA
ncbi:uncharacterized protein LTR77_006654 [Saxophila tyrrhenica]|uniref:Lytic polysaccharide monooxygenase n=1 Tax=Saxophila tyrrhenica TaxID=1690608 RepID=A0AAV9P9H5_9PEZI|nr:hypothetical protein LTR77_006654 [Saxophila tyrrhenica]